MLCAHERTIRVMAQDSVQVLYNIRFIHTFRKIVKNAQRPNCVSAREKSFHKIFRNSFDEYDVRNSLGYLVIQWLFGTVKYDYPAKCYIT